MNDIDNIQKRFLQQDWITELQRVGQGAFTFLLKKFGNSLSISAICWQWTVIRFWFCCCCPVCIVVISFSLLVFLLFGCASAPSSWLDKCGQHMPPQIKAGTWFVRFISLVQVLWLTFRPLFILKWFFWLLTFTAFILKWLPFFSWLWSSNTTFWTFITKRLWRLALGTRGTDSASLRWFWLERGHRRRTWAHTTDFELTLNWLILKSVTTCLTVISIAMSVTVCMTVIVIAIV